MSVKIVVKTKGLELGCNSRDFTGIQETADGLVFSFFNGGILLHYNNQNIPEVTKRTIAETKTHNVKNGKVVFDLDQPLRPVQIELTIPPEEK